MRYKADYIDDCGRINKNLLLSVFLLSNNTRQETTENFDRSILPDSYFSPLSTDLKAVCSNSGIRKKREFLVILETNFILVTPIIYIGGSTNFRNLFKEFVDRGLIFKYVGERLKDYYLEISING